MRTVKCPQCFSSFTEADKEWDLARESGNCPFCDSPLNQFSSVSQKISGARSGANAMQQVEKGKKGLVVLAILGSGILLGLASETILALALSSAAVGVVLNAYLLFSSATQAGRSERIPMALMGAIPAGVFDGLKIFLIGLVVRWIAGAMG